MVREPAAAEIPCELCRRRPLSLLYSASLAGTSGSTMDTEAGHSTGTTTAMDVFFVGAVDGGGGGESGSGCGGRKAPSGSMGETRPDERMRLGSMNFPSLDEVGEQWNDAARGSWATTSSPPPGTPPRSWWWCSGVLGWDGAEEEEEEVEGLAAQATGNLGDGVKDRQNTR
ncbi:unnamed protein product [Urochloa humidicola]